LCHAFWLLPFFVFGFLLVDSFKYDVKAFDS
jgi:hypothetical protein